ncbi:ParB-like protein [Rheinheimera sp. NSM]|uniref:ParB-like protein n=1 Tax=Rheinheimera sp. NSM TaxID=3457884 RepID=UPI0040373944
MTKAAIAVIVMLLSFATFKLGRFGLLSGVHTVPYCYRLSLSVLLLCSGVALAQPQWQANTVIETTLGQLQPTQSVIAHEQVNYKLALYRHNRRALFADLCESAGWGKKVSFTAESTPDKPDSYSCDNAGKHKRKLQQLKTAVLGPDKQLYLTDGHHSFSAFYDMPQGGADFPVTVLITAEYHEADPAAFWRRLQQQGNAWLYNAAGKPVTYQQLPTSLGRAGLENDPYRAALYFLHGGVWAKPEPAIPFVEFYWAQYLRQQPGLQFPGYYSAAEYLQWLERIHGHLAGLTTTTRVFAGFNAADLGWRGGEHYSQLNDLLCQRSGNSVSTGKLAIALQQRGMPVSCDSRQYLDRTALSTGLNTLPTAINADGSVNVLIEIAAGSADKWQQNKAEPLQLEWERQDGTLRQIRFLPYPANYGIVSGTMLAKEHGGDGDPLDVLVLGSALPQGTVQPVRLIGVLRMLDNGEQDDKLLAVPLQGVFSALHDVAQLQQQFPGVIEQLQHWFRHYKGAAGNTILQQTDDAAAAMVLLKASQF